MASSKGRPRAIPACLIKVEWAKNYDPASHEQHSVLVKSRSEQTCLSLSPPSESLQVPTTVERQAPGPCTLPPPVQQNKPSNLNQLSTPGGPGPMPQDPKNSRPTKIVASVSTWKRGAETTQKT